MTDTLQWIRRRTYLVAIGGGRIPLSITGVIKSLTAKQKPEAVIVPAASASTKDSYSPLFEREDIPVTVLPLRNREDAEDARNTSALETADIVFFSGGNQLRLKAALEGSASEEMLLRRMSEGVVIAGTSAGAAVMGELMPAGGTGREAVMCGSVDSEDEREGDEDGDCELRPVFITTGLGLYTGLAVDQHFFARGRFGRLAHLVTRYRQRQILGLGIDESTAAVIDWAADVMFVVGDSSAAVVSAPRMAVDNMREGGSLASFGINVDFLSEGYGYDLNRRRPLPREDAEEMVAAALET